MRSSTIWLCRRVKTSLKNMPKITAVVLEGAARAAVAPGAAVRAAAARARSGGQFNFHARSRSFDRTTAQHFTAVARANEAESSRSGELSRTSGTSRFRTQFSHLSMSPRLGGQLLFRIPARCASEGRRLSSLALRAGMLTVHCQRSDSPAQRLRAPSNAPIPSPTALPRDTGCALCLRRDWPLWI